MVAYAAAGVIAGIAGAARRAARAWVTIRCRIGSLSQTLLSSSPAAQPPVR